MASKFRHPCSCRSGAQNGAFHRMRASLGASVMDLCTPQKSCVLGANELLFGQNEAADFTEMLIFTICQRDTHADRGQVGPAGPSLPREKKYPVGGAAHPPLQQSDSCPQAPEKWLLHHFQPPHLPGMCQERIFLGAFLERFWGHFGPPRESLGPPKPGKRS